MSAVLTVQEPSAKYLVNLQPPFVRHFDLIAQAPGGVARLRELILTLAVQGKLVPQDPSDEPAGELLKKIRAEKDRLIAEGKIKRDKPLAEIAEEAKPFELPGSWEWFRFGELLDFQGGGQPPKSNFSDVPLPDYVQLIQIRDLGDKPQPVFIPKKLASKFCTPTDVMVGRYGASVGKVFWGKDGAYNVALVKMVDEYKAFDRHYLYLLLVSPVGQNLFSGISRSAQDGFNKNDIEAKLIPLPPFAEQTRIVTRVEELMQLCDALEASGQLEAQQHAQLVSTLLGTLTQSETPEALADNWQRIATHFDVLLDRPEAVDALEQTILQLAVRGLLVPQDPTDEPASVLLQKIRTEKDHLIAQGKIKRDKPLPPITDEEKPFDLPQGWKWSRMGSVVNASEAGWSPTCIGSPRTAGKWGVLKVSAVSWGDFDAMANKELPADLTPRPEYEVKDGDFLLSRANTAELVARSVVVEKAEPRLMLSDKIIRLDVSRQMSRDFLNLCNNAEHARNHYVVNASGTSSSMKNVSREVVLATPIPLPPLAEQTRIMTRVIKLRALCADLRRCLSARQAVQGHLADALVI